jgi:hypothetical protein
MHISMKNGIVETASLSAGGVGPIPAYLSKSSAFLKGKEVSAGVIAELLKIVQSEISPISDARGSASYKRLLLAQLIKAHFTVFRPGDDTPNLNCTARMKNIDSFTHTRGESVYLDDIPTIQGTLFGAIFGSPSAHGKITKLDLSEAEAMEGVIRIFTYRDIPGENQIGGIVPDEPLLAEKEVHFNGMPIAFVVAEI